MLSDERLKALREAAQDLLYLMDRGYRKEYAIRFVSDHYRLQRWERNVLNRVIHPTKYSAEARAKLLQPSDIEGKTISIDGYNVLNTVIAGKRGLPLFESTDGIIRDISEIHASFKLTDETLKTALEVIEETLQLKPKDIQIYLDAQISKSGILAKKLREQGAEVILTKHADKTILADTNIIATSDSIIIEQKSKIFDLAGHICRKRSHKIVKLLEYHD
ncbi:MAG: DUF434 domain-containing protein [Aigarchaeota archaeon]|nr:DUF434 domain-containing protein [Candidatus Pelearchaeum maunauluense]